VFSPPNFGILTLFPIGAPMNRADQLNNCHYKDRV